ncbi:hypothetical protein T310_9638 [Rasamsonia emersonii CBS 393.64]|uniref:C6 transcription factor n=1 Tax=Rasamsonia emersonii (strain ATCC 16479 / CBS 393.64 / IMI 116815) TaxID=1408163 RepID=A0A0F4YEU4_RASE3|nr:hypothetical protein T310_9638 [Rasamsonia emersonii CBS 393.64]KKA16737.1 hypothetical protein T310_9638 [Rasamsonia emersonii CBS 393.64]
MRKCLLDKHYPLVYTNSDVIVLLVVALGSIASRQEPLPVPQVEPFEGWTETEIASAVRQNIEAIPGLKYFVLALEIFRIMTDIDPLHKVQIHLLIALYADQIMLLSIRHGHILRACQGCMPLMRKVVSGTESQERTLLVKCAFLTCVMLERDISTVLEIPRSGISEYFDTIATEVFPSLEHWQGFVNPKYKEIMLCYQSANLALIQFSLQCQHNKDSAKATAREQMDTILKELESWKAKQPTWTKWIENDESPPPSDSFTAILCLRYFYVQHHARFPFVHQYVHSGPPGDPDTYWEVDIQANECISTAWRFFDIMDRQMGKPELTFPNLVGFLHMQFGMILSVLSLQKDWPRYGFDKYELADRLGKAISFLRKYRHYSPLLYKDAEILDFISDDLT